MVQKIEPCNMVVQIFMNICGRLKTERERLNLSQTRVAELLGVGKTTVINWEKGASAPDAVQLSMLGAAGADVLYILMGQRSQALPHEATLPADERVLVDSYRRCNAQARQNLIQTAALLSAGMPVVGSLTPITESTNIKVSSTQGHAAGRDVRINSGEKENGKKRNIKPRGTRSGT